MHDGFYHFKHFTSGFKNVLAHFLRLIQTIVDKGDV